MGVWYRTGTVSVTNGSPNVVGVGTLWLTQASVGDMFLGPNLVEHEITAITDDTHLTVMQVNGTAAYAGTTASAQLYAIIRNFTSTMPAQLASQLAAMMTAWHVTTDELTAWLSGTGSTTVHDAVGNAYNVQTPTALNAAWNGRLVKNVAGGVDVTLTSAEASNLFIELTGTLTANINVIMPAGVRHNFVFNNTAGAFVPTAKTAAGTGVAVAQGVRALLECDGTNVLNAVTALLTGYTSGAGTVSATDTVLQAVQKLDGNVALKAPLVSPSFTTPVLGTPTSGALDNCTSNTEAANNNSTQLATTAYADRLTGGTLPGSFTTLSASGNIQTGPTGYHCIGGTPLPTYGLYITGTRTTGASQYGLALLGAADSTVTGTYTGYQVGQSLTAGTVLGNYVAVDIYLMQSANMVGSTLANNYGILIRDSSAGGNSIVGVSCDITAGVGKWGIFTSTANSAFGGNVAIGGTTAPLVACDVTGAIRASTTIRTGGYTVATLPAGTTGDRAYVTDATAPTYLGALTGGGAVVCPVFKNATGWVSA